MRSMRESSPPRWGFSNVLGLLSRLWQRFMGDDEPALIVPELNFNTAAMTALHLEIPPYELNTTFQIPRVLYQPPLETLLIENPPYLDHSFSRFFQNTQPDMHQWREWREWYRPEPPTAHEDVHQWWRQLHSAALPDPENFRNSSKLAGYPDLEIPEEFICAITHQIMTDPVYDPNFPQQRYDRYALERWLVDHPTNPLTRTPLATTDLVADKVLQTRIDEFVASALSTTLSICRM